MWYIIVILTMMNACLPQFRIVNEYLRITVGPAIISIFDVAIFVGFVWAIFRGGNVQAEVPPDRTPPVFTTAMVLFCLAIVGGSIGMLREEGNWKIKLDGLRDWVTFPAVVFTGYRLVGGPRDILRLVRAFCLAGVCNAIAMLIAQFSGADITNAKKLFGTLRQVLTEFNPEYASIAGLLMIYMFVTRRRVLYWWFLPPAVLICLGGYMLTLSRTSAVIVVFGATALFFCLPKETRLKNVMATVVIVPALAAFFWIMLLVSDAAFGKKFADTVVDHFYTILPAEREKSSDERAWDSRMGGITAELKLFAENPAIGVGLGTNFNRGLTGQSALEASTNHNSWTSALSQTGLIGFAALIFLFASGALVGWRMMRDNASVPTVLMGALSYLTAAVFFVRFTCTASTGFRMSMLYCLVIGAMYRAREIQRLLPTYAPVDARLEEPDDLLLVDPLTGRAVPLDFGGRPAVPTPAHFN